MSNILGNMPPVFGSGYRGVVPAPTAADVSAQNILRADGTWGAQATSGPLPSQTSNAGKLLTTDGTNASWASSLNTFTFGDVQLGTSGPSAKSSIAARAARQGLVFDGTAGATCPNVNLSGTAGFTVAAWITVNSLAANNVIVDGAGGAFALYVGTDGRVARLDRVTGLQVATPAGVITTGKMYAIAYVRGAIYVDGILQASFTDTSNYAGYIRRVGWAESSDSYATGYLSAYLYNRALSAAEVVSLYESGVPSGADYPSQVAGTALLTGDNSTFTGGAGNWAGVNGGSVSAGSGVLTVTSSAAYVGGRTANNIITKGSRYRLQFTSASYTGTITNIWVFSSDGALISNTTAGTTTVEFTASATSYVGFSASSGQSGTFTLDNVTLVPVGLLLAPDAAQAGGGLTWYDTSGNAANITLPASGVTWNVPSSLKTASGWTFGGDTKINSTAVKGTGGASPLILGTATGGANDFNLQFFRSAAGLGDSYYAFQSVEQGVSYRNITLNPNGGNVLVGTATDGGQKLQVAGTFLAGPIGSKIIDTTNGYFYGGSGNNPGVIGAFGDSLGNTILFINRGTGNDATLTANFGNLNLAAASNVKTANVFNVTNTTSSTSTSTGALTVGGGVGVGGDATIGGTVRTAGSSNSAYLSINTNQADNTAGPVTITIPDNTAGFVTVASLQSGIGKSSWMIPYVKNGGTIVLGTPTKSIISADPVSSATASSGNISLALIAANTFCKWGINSTPF